MTVIIHHINRMPSRVKILRGAPEELVTHRELRTSYETNRDIKMWACWFLLKSLTTSGKIEEWINQKSFILHYVQMNENTFRRRLKEMQQMNLVTIDDDGSIVMASYEAAAGVLNIAYCGTYPIEYNPEKHAGKQIFQYFLRGEEIRVSQQIQLEALTYYLDKNPMLRNDLYFLMVKAGADGQRLLRDPRYFQERLLHLQKKLFKEGSELLQYAYAHRADINRGVKSIRKAHCYKATTSVSYMKKRMQELKVIQVTKMSVTSKGRSRLYIPDPDGKGGKRDGYKYIGAIKQTALFLTDQISFLYECMVKKAAPQRAANAA